MTFNFEGSPLALAFVGTVFVAMLLAFFGHSLRWRKLVKALGARMIGKTLWFHNNGRVCVLTVGGGIARKPGWPDILWRLCVPSTKQGIWSFQTDQVSILDKIEHFATRLFDFKAQERELVHEGKRFRLRAESPAVESLFFSQLPTILSHLKDLGPEFRIRSRREMLIYAGLPHWGYFLSINLIGVEKEPLRLKSIATGLQALESLLPEE